MFWQQNFLVILTQINLGKAFLVNLIIKFILKCKL